ncbi:hypothetical protein HDK77DRAFT_319350 [Phyllosticta capitalensis]|uniref:Uncharacterized protein n=1 Tax=Phyllosticta capitalensis TaxID=121624 RepID=A0ABR1YIR9_9PEZI
MPHPQRIFPFALNPQGPNISQPPPRLSSRSSQTPSFVSHLGLPTQRASRESLPYSRHHHHPRVARGGTRGTLTEGPESASPSTRATSCSVRSLRADRNVAGRAPRWPAPFFLPLLRRLLRPSVAAERRDCAYRRPSFGFLEDRAVKASACASLDGNHGNHGNCGISMGSFLEVRLADIIGWWRILHGSGFCEDALAMFSPDIGSPFLTLQQMLLPWKRLAVHRTTTSM